MKVPILAALAAIVAVSMPTATIAKSKKHVRHKSTRVYVDRGYYSTGRNVYSAGTYVGSDPDPRLRQQMLIDFNRGVDFPGAR